MDILIKQIDAIIRENQKISTSTQTIKIWVENHQLCTETKTEIGATILTKSEPLTDIEIKQRLYSIKEHVLQVNMQLKNLKKQVDNVN